MRGDHRRCQAEKLLIALSRFPEPALVRILKQAAQSAGLPTKSVVNLSGHSMRVGAAQDLIASGLSILPIMQGGGWKMVNVVSRYVENANRSSLLRHTRDQRE